MTEYDLNHLTVICYHSNKLHLMVRHLIIFPLNVLSPLIRRCFISPSNLFKMKRNHFPPPKIINKQTPNIPWHTEQTISDTLKYFYNLCPPKCPATIPLK